MLASLNREHTSTTAASEHDEVPDPSHYRQAHAQAHQPCLELREERALRPPCRRLVSLRRLDLARDGAGHARDRPLRGATALRVIACLERKERLQRRPSYLPGLDPPHGVPNRGRALPSLDPPPVDPLRVAPPSAPTSPVDPRRPRRSRPSAGGSVPCCATVRARTAVRAWWISTARGQEEEEGSLGGATKTEGDANHHSPLAKPGYSPLAKPGSARTAELAVSSKPPKSSNLGLLEPG